MKAVPHQDAGVKQQFWLARTWPQLAHARDLLYELVIRDLRLRYKRSILGVAWSLVLPLCQLAVFMFVFQRVLSLNIPNYPLYVFSALLPWSWFQASLIAGAGAITDNRELVRRPGFPVVILPVVSVTANLVHFVLALPILMAVLVLQSGLPSDTIFLLPLVIVIQFALTVGFTYLVATFQVAFRDTLHLLTVLLQLAFYLTPIFYDRRLVPPRFQAFYELNPLVHLIEGYRSILLHDAPLDLLPLLGLGVFAGGLVWIGHAVLVRVSDTFAEEL